MGHTLAWRGPLVAIGAGLAVLCTAVAAPALARKSDPAAPKGTVRKSFAQDLVDKTVAKHPELIGLDFLAKPPNGSESVVIASTSRERIGRPTDPDDLQVFKTGKPRVQINASGKQDTEVVVQLQDVIGRPIGLAKMTFPRTAETDAEALIHKAQEINEDIGEQIPTGARLLEAAWIEQSEEDEDAQSLPMTKAVVSGKALEQSAQEGYSEAVKDVAGVAPGNSKGTANDSIYIRGIKLNLFSNYRINGGLPTAGVLTSPTEDKERIVALKGANGLMFGVASPAGIINMITKRAGDKDVTTLSVLGNSFGQIGASADVGRRFLAGRQLGVRANASVVSLENGVRGTTGDGEFASLGVDWKALPRLALQGDFEYYAKHVPEQGGVSLVSPMNGVVPITPVPDPRNLLSGRWAKLRADTKNVQLRADFLLLEGWRVLAEAGRSYAYRKRFTVRIRNYDIDTGAGSASISTVNQEYTNSFERVELLGRFPTWFLRHDLTIGVSRSRRESATPSQNTAVSQMQNIYHPIVLAEPVYNMAPTSLPLQFSQDIGFYGYDTISIGPKFKFLLGVRVTRDKEDNGVKRNATTVATPAVGALYDILPSLTLFASFMEGLEGGATAPVGALNVYEILPSAVSSQKEVGIRVSALQEVTASASAFQIIRANAVTDPVTTVFSEAGDIDYKGIEASVSVELPRRVTLDVAGQWMHAIQRAPGNPINGLVPENTPSLLGNARLTYGPQWVPGLTLNVAASGVTKRYVNPQDQGTIPGYVLLSAGIGYQMRIQKTRFAFQLTGDNLANIRYWNSVQTGTYGTGMDRSFKFSAKVGF